MRLRTGSAGSPRTVRGAARLMYAGAALELAAMAVVLLTVGGLKAAVLHRYPALTAAQWHGIVLAHIVPVAVGAPIAAGLWLWMAWANRRGRSWARGVFAALFMLTTVSLFSGLSRGAATYAPADAVAGAALWLVALAALALSLSQTSRAGTTGSSAPRLRDRSDGQRSRMKPYFQTHPVGVLYLFAVVTWYSAEIVQFFRQRKWRREAPKLDRPSFWAAFVIYVVVAVGLLVRAPHIAPGAAIGYDTTAFAVGMVMLVGGAALRLWSFHVLGEYFTFTVKASSDQPVVTAGPYHVLRHPGYAGGLLATIGIGVLYGNWLSLAALALALPGDRHLAYPHRGGGAPGDDGRPLPRLRRPPQAARSARLVVSGPATSGTASPTRQESGCPAGQKAGRGSACSSCSSKLHPIGPR